MTIPKNTKHRIINNSKKVQFLLEMAFGDCDEKDIVRYEDDYGRIT